MPGVREEHAHKIHLLRAVVEWRPVPRRRRTSRDASRTPPERPASHKRPVTHGRTYPRRRVKRALAAASTILLAGGIAYGAAGTPPERPTALLARGVHPVVPDFVLAVRTDARSPTDLERRLSADERLTRSELLGRMAVIAACASPDECDRVDRDLGAIRRRVSRDRTLVVALDQSPATPDARSVPAPRRYMVLQGVNGDVLRRLGMTAPATVILTPDGRVAAYLPRRLTVYEATQALRAARAHPAGAGLRGPTG